MAKIRGFLASQSLDEETVSYLNTAYEEGGLEDLLEVAESFLSAEALAALAELAPPPASRARPATEVAPKSAEAGPLGSMATLASAGLEAAEPGADGVAAEVTPAAAAEKPSRLEKRQAKVKEKSKGKAAAKARTGQPSGDSGGTEGQRELGDVAAFGLAETEEGLDAFDSFAICWGKAGRARLRQLECGRDINLPVVFVGIVTDLGQKDLINGAQLRIYRGHKYGLIGRNGCGKTTLLRRIARRQLPGLPPLRYGYVAQELVGTDASVMDAACSGDREYEELKRARAQLEAALSAGDADASRMAELTEDFAEVVTRLDEVEAFFGTEGLRGHAREILLGLQFTPEMLERPTRTLSGGWRMRLALAQALLSRADCLLLDEPTNHLDFAGVLWLQDFLKTRLNPDCMLVMISHDRAFLDDVVTDIIEISRQDIEQGSGNYSAWQQRKEQEREHVASRLEANERERERTKDMIQKMRESAQGKKGKEADVNKLRQAKQRETQLYGKVSSSGEAKTYGRLELANVNGAMVDIKALAAEKLAVEEKVKIRLPEPELLSGALLSLDGASYTIAEVERTILREVTLTLEPQSRVAVVGENGAGKTTLLRWLEGHQWPARGGHRHPKLKVAHISQHHLEGLEAHLAETCVGWLRGLLPPPEPGQDPNTTLSNVAPDQFLFGYLANFGIGGIARQSIGTLSGGQKARLAFAGQVWPRPHLLLLDEPTNHLDIETLEALAAALKAFPGASVIVSHNQGFLSDVCNELWTVEGGRLSAAGRGEGGFAAEFAAYRRRVLRKLRAGR